MSELNVDTINEQTAANGVTIDGVLIKDGSVKGNGTGRKNYIINGNFDIWQRGTSGTGGYCSADRWYFGTSGATGTLARGSFTAGQTDVPNNPKYYANLTTTVADDNTNILQRIEDVYTLAGETITISFWAKHTTSGPTSFIIKTRQHFGTGGSTPVVTNSSGQTTTTSWQKYTRTVTLGSISGKTIASDSRLELELTNPNNETFDFQIAQVQVEKGSVATDFEYRPIAEELSLCQRYYAKSYNQATSPGTASTNVGAINLIISATTNNGDRNTVFLPQTMREAPTVTLYSTVTGTAGKSRIEQTGTDTDVTAYYIGESNFNYYLNGTQTDTYTSQTHYQADAEL